MDRMPKRIAPGDGCALTFRVTPPIEAQITNLLSSRRSRDGRDLQNRPPEYLTLALPPPPVSARVLYSIDGEEGEIQALRVLPCTTPRAMRGRCRWRWCRRFSALAHTQVIRRAQIASAQLSVDVRTADRSTGTVRPEVPQELAGRATIGDGQLHPVRPASCRIQRATRRGERSALSRTGVVEVSSRDYGEGYSLVARPDLGGFFYYRRYSAPAWSKVKFRTG